MDSDMLVGTLRLQGKKALKHSFHFACQHLDFNNDFYSMLFKNMFLIDNIIFLQKLDEKEKVFFLFHDLLPQHAKFFERCLDCLRASNNSPTAEHLEANYDKLSASTLISSTADSRLYLAAKSGDVEEVRRSLSADDDDDWYRSEKEGYTPLMAAVINGHFHVAEILLLDGKHGATKEARDNQGRTALALAVINNQIESVALLLRFGANVNAIGGNALEIDLSHNRVLCTPLILACENGNLEIVRLLLSVEKCKAGIELTDRFGRTALLMASKCGRLEVIKLLLANGANIYATSSAGFSVVAIAIDGRTAHFDVLRYFIDEVGLSADLRGKILKWENKEAPTALSRAARYGHAEIVSYLLEKPGRCDVFAKNQIGYVPFIDAILSKKVAVVRLFLEKARMDINAVYPGDKTPLMAAAHCGCIEMAEFLLENGADVNVRSSRKGETALILAVCAGPPLLCRMLLDRGADHTVRNERGASALSTAVLLDQEEQVIMLLEKENSGYYDADTVRYWIVDNHLVAKRLQAVLAANRTDFGYNE